MSDQDNTRSAIERHQQEQRLISVLADEFRDLHDAPSDVPLDTLDDIYAAVHRLRDGHNPQPRTAICLSGGGIRSATAVVSHGMLVSPM